MKMAVEHGKKINHKITLCLLVTQKYSNRTTSRNHTAHAQTSKPGVLTCLRSDSRSIVATLLPSSAANNGNTADG